MNSSTDLSVQPVGLSTELTYSPPLFQRVTRPALLFLPGSVTGSFLDTDMICSECEEAEKNEPDYLVAKRRELEEVKKGNLNYKGWRNEMND